MLFVQIIYGVLFCMAALAGIHDLFAGNLDGLTQVFYLTLIFTVIIIFFGVGILIVNFIIKMIVDHFPKILPFLIFGIIILVFAALLFSTNFESIAPAGP